MANLIRRLTMPLPELKLYYRERRKERFEKNEPFGGVRLRRMLHPVLVSAMKIKHVLDKQVVTVLGDQRVPTDRPIVYAATHIGWDDIEMILSSLGDHAYLFWGDPNESYQTIDGFLLDVNGIIVCDTGDKADRYIGKETCVRWLSRGGNLLIFPEGAWNITESLPVLPLYAGAAEMAIRSGAEIVPVAIEQCGRDYTVNIGRNIPAAGMAVEQKQQLTDTLRDAVASLRWEIWTSKAEGKRAEIPADYRQRQMQEMRELQKQKQDAYTMEDIERTRFHTGAEQAQKDAFAHLDRLIPRKENAFLFGAGK